jgi:hypothetical protein
LTPPVAGASKSGRALLTEGVMGVLVSKLTPPMPSIPHQGEALGGKTPGL